MSIKLIALADLEEYSEEDLFKHLINYYTAPHNIRDLYSILVAYESVGDLRCDSNSYFLFKDKKTNELYELCGSHCSCYGFEDQFDLSKTNLDYLKSNRFYIATGGYDDDAQKNVSKIKTFLQEL